MGFTWDALEQRAVLSHVGGFQHLQDVAHVASVSSRSTAGSTTTSSTLSAAQQTLRNEVQAILSASGTTIGELTAIHTAFEALQADGLKPISQSALASFENSLVVASANDKSLTDGTLLAQFEALYTTTTTTLTDQETIDLTTAYKALTAAVTSSNITSANIATIDKDFAAVLAAEGNTSSTATYPYFSLITGGHIRLGGGGCH
jgi:hypothetical protein